MQIYAKRIENDTGNTVSKAVCRPIIDLPNAKFKNILIFLTLSGACSFEQTISLTNSFEFFVVILFEWTCFQRRELRHVSSTSLEVTLSMTAFLFFVRIVINICISIRGNYMVELDDGCFVCSSVTSVQTTWWLWHRKGGVEVTWFIWNFALIFSMILFHLLLTASTIHSIASREVEPRKTVGAAIYLPPIVYGGDLQQSLLSVMSMSRYLNNTRNFYYIF